MKRSLGRKTLAVPAPTWVIGTFDAADRPNLMTAAWGGICCSKPPSVCVSLREATHSYAAILERKAFSINVPTAAQVALADYVGLVSGRDVDKLEAAGLTVVRADHVDAPLVEEFPLNLECRLSHHLKIGLHTLFVGEILDVKADEAILNEEGRPSLSRANPPVFSPGDGAYYEIGGLLGPAFVIGKKIPERG